ncbi:MAG: epoxyqueuosine reductase QueH [Thermoplasmata archaeon]|nr:epoxyqueuosine reductase QueH [Thermoplasmata archaeon]
MKMLVHICCAPCFAYPHKRLMEEGHEVTGYWYNPNIHPYMEYMARKEALQKYAEIEEVEVIYEGYDFIDYLKMQLQNVERPQRCINCYSYRLERAAKYAKQHGFDAFTTTLLVSHHQYHDSIKKVGEEMGEKYGIPFYYEDFRPGYKQGKAIAKAYSLYSQKYCGCLISEWERFGGMKEATR